MTVLGAALTAFVGVGVFKSIENALRSLEWELRAFNPSVHLELYEQKYKVYKGILRALKGYYEKWI